MSSTLDSEVKPKRTRRGSAVKDNGDAVNTTKKPRQKAVRKTVTKKATVRQESKKAVKDEYSAEIEAEFKADSGRKAPTSIAAQEVERKQKKKQLIIVGVVLFIGIGASAGVGLTDQGQINVNQTIEARNERVRTNKLDERDVNTSQLEVPVQNTNTKKADGGLIGLGTGGNTPKPAAEIVAATTTAENASSTEEIATSTQAVEEEDVSKEAAPESAEVSNENKEETVLEGEITEPAT